MPWIKGESGNPGGKPAGLQEVRRLARQYTEHAIKTLAHLTLRARNEHVRVAAANAILDRAWGKPTQPISGEDGEPITVKLEDARARLARAIAAEIDTGADPARAGEPQ